MLFVACCRLFVGCHLLFVFRYALSVVWCLLFVGSCSLVLLASASFGLFVVCCVFFVCGVYCLLFVQ